MGESDRELAEQSSVQSDPAAFILFRHNSPKCSWIPTRRCEQPGSAQVDRLPIPLRNDFLTIRPQTRCDLISPKSDRRRSSGVSQFIRMLALNQKCRESRRSSFPNRRVLEARVQRFEA